jgi:glycosyltransferase involved in cell wall biosynthesis
MHQGNALRNFGLLRGLVDAGCQVSLASFGTPTDETAPLTAMLHRLVTVPPPHRTLRTRLLGLLTDPRPDLALRFESTAFRAALNRLLVQETFDVVEIEGLEMAIYAPLVRAAQPSAAVLYDAHNAEYALQEAIARVEKRSPRRIAAALYSRIQRARIRRFEAEVVRAADAVIAVSEEDAQALDRLQGENAGPMPEAPTAEAERARAVVLANGLFTDAYATDDGDAISLGEHALVFTGKMDYRPNVDAVLWFTESVLPLVEAEIPDVRLYIVGQQPHSALGGLRAKPNIAVTGWVPRVQPYLHGAAVFIAPLRMGSGTRLKLLEAMAAGCAIAATPMAASGLSANALAAMALADDAPGFARAVIGLLHDAAKRDALGAAARTVAQREYDWRALIPTLLDVQHRLLARSSGARSSDARSADARPAQAPPAHSPKAADRAHG